MRFEELDNLDERRLKAKQRIELHQARMSAAYNRMVRFRAYRPGDLVLKMKPEVIMGSRMLGKLESKWEGLGSIQTGAISFCKWVLPFSGM